MRPRPVPALLVALLAGAVALVLAEGRRSREDPAAILRVLRVAQGPLLPPVLRSGAASASDPARYSRERLHELVDGAAEGYLARGFESCAAATYAFDTGGAAPLEVAAEAHRFADASSALAQLAAERPRAAAPVAGLPGAVSDGSVLLSVEGRDLLKLTALEPSGRGRERLRALALAWHEEMKP